MAERSDIVFFCRGFIMGSLVGLVAAAYSYSRGDSRAQRLASDEERIPEASHTFRQHSTDLDLRREASETAGDPTILTPSVATGRTVPPAITFERSSGNLGPASTGEVLEVPGQPGQTLDYSDAAQPVKSVLRTHRISATGT